MIKKIIKINIYICASVLLSILLMQDVTNVKANDGIYETVQVADIEISEYEKKMDVGTSQTITATVLPIDAQDSVIQYKSSNPNVATVNSSGEVKAVAKGNVTIYVSAGSVTKELPIEVKVGTVGIKVDKVCVVLKVGESYKLTTMAIPDEANQIISYKVDDKNVAEVSSAGNITGLNVGTTSVIVSNGDYQTAVTVIVNMDSHNQSDNDENIKTDKFDTKYDYEVSVDDTKLITSDWLYDIYNNKQTLSIKGNGYKISVDGKNIVNYENELYTDIGLKKDTNGTTFVINDCKPLCGNITVSFDEDYGKYVYIYNQERKKYELLDIDGTKEMVLSSSGSYMITDKKIAIGTGWVAYALIAVAVIITGGGIAYIVVKKRYWFW